MPQPFTRALLDRLAATDEIDIETRSAPEASSHLVPIWVVVVNEEVYVRSVRGTSGRWFRNLVRNPIGAIRMAETRFAVRAEVVNDDQIIKQVSEAYLKKYAESPYANSIVAPQTLNATLHLILT